MLQELVKKYLDLCNKFQAFCSALKFSSLCCLLLATVVVVKVVLMPFLFPCLMGDLINF